MTHSIVAFVAVLLIIRPFVNKQNDKKMKNKSVEDYLKYYLSLKSPQYAVMIKGPWGCGKTFFVKMFLDNNEDKETGDNTVINLKPIYISLNGMRTLESLREAIRAELNPLLYSKAAKIGKEVFKGLLKTTLRIDLDRNGDTKTDGAISGNLDASAILTLAGSDVSGTKALFLDDLERTKIDLEELFGFINNLVEHHSCKVILLADENKLIEKFPEYITIKEKLVGPAFEISWDVEVIFNKFLKEAVKIEKKYVDIKKHIKENKDQIIKIYEASQCKNLRIFRRSIVDFFHFAYKFHYQLKKKNKTCYDLFMNYIIIIFFIAYFELKVGNKDGVKYDPGLFIDKYLNHNDKEENPIQKTNDKYRALLDEFGLDFLSSYKEIEIVNDYLGNQALDEGRLVKELSSYQLFRAPQKIEDWVKLKRYEILDDLEFLRIYSNELEKLKKAEISNIEEFLTFVSHIFFFDKEKIVEEDIDAILEYADIQIDQIIKQSDSFKEIKNRLISCMSVPRVSERFLMFLQSVIDKLEKYELEEVAKNIQEYFSALSRGETTFLNYIDMTSSKYNYPLKNRPYLKYLKPEEFYSNLLILNNSDLKNIYEYFVERYKKHNFLGIYYQEELPFIIKVRDLLISRSFDGIKGLWIRRIKELLDIAIADIQSQRTLTE